MPFQIKYTTPIANGFNYRHDILKNEASLGLCIISVGNPDRRRSLERRFSSKNHRAQINLQRNDKNQMQHLPQREPSFSCHQSPPCRFLQGREKFIPGRKKIK